MAYIPVSQGTHAGTHQQFLLTGFGFLHYLRVGRPAAETPNR